MIDSRVSEPGDSIRRRRRCVACKKRFTTYETRRAAHAAGRQDQRHARRLRRRQACATASSARCTSGPVPTEFVDQAVDRIIAAGAGAGRARDPVAPGRRDGDAGAPQARQGRLHPLRVRLPQLSRTCPTSATRCKEVEAPRKRVRKSRTGAPMTAFPRRRPRAHGARARARRERPLHDDAQSARRLRDRARTATVIGEGWHERAGERARRGRRARRRAARGAIRAARRVYVDARALQSPRTHAALRRRRRSPPASRASSRRWRDPESEAARRRRSGLRAAGIAVDVGLLEDAGARAQHRLRARA